MLTIRSWLTWARSVVDLLMSDSTNSGVEDFSISEKKVAQEILEITRKCNGRLIVATFASNVHRVSQILEAAVRCGTQGLHLRPQHGKCRQHQP